MTEPPQDEQRPGPGAPQPHGQQPHARPRPFPQQPAPPPQQFGQPYGQPQHAGAGQSYGVPAQKSRVGLIAAATVAVLLLIGVVVVLARTLGTTVLDRAAVERDVAAQFEEIHGLSIDLSCPDEMPVESGAEYTCTGTTKDGQEVTLAIQIADPSDDAEYTWVEI